MVNIDKLNATIESLDIKSKEIDSLLDMQKKFKHISKEIESINSKIKLEKENITEMEEQNKKAFLQSQKVIDDVEIVVNNKFSSFNDILKNNNNVVMNLEDEIKHIMSEFEAIKDIIAGKLENIEIENTNTIVNINKELNMLVNNVTNIEGNIKQLNGDILKQLSEIKIENYKMINEMQGAFDTKIGILKSDMVFEIRKLEERMNNIISSQNSKITNEFKEQQKYIINVVSEETSNKLANLEKKNVIFMIVIIILGIINVVSALK